MEALVRNDVKKSLNFQRLKAFNGILGNLQ